MVYYILLDLENYIVGVFEDINNDFNYILVNDELYEYIITCVGRKKYNGSITQSVLTIEDKNKFEFLPTPTPKTELEILRETVDMLVLSTLGGGI